MQGINDEFYIEKMGGRILHDCLNDTIPVAPIPNPAPSPWHVSISKPPCNYTVLK